jgi:spore maturation protein CgeB
MRLVVFGLTMSSSWGNGHATLWRGLCRGLSRLGHRVAFFERDFPFYASHRDRTAFDDVDWVLYGDWDEILPRARRERDDADVVMVTSYCPDALAATRLAAESPRARRVFYDLDAPVTLDRLAAGQPVEYLGPRGLEDFDLVLSYAGGSALEELSSRLGARRVAPLYGSVDPDVHRPGAPVEEYAGALSYLGTYAADRHAALDLLLAEPARRRPDLAFVLGGSQYPDHVRWPDNVRTVGHVPPSRHSSFFQSSRLTLNLTRGPMLRTGHCPSGRLFEAAACGAAIVTDAWSGLEQFFEPGREILVARGPDDVTTMLDLSDDALAAIGRAARERALSEHTAERRALELERLLEPVAPRGAGVPVAAR